MSKNEYGKIFYFNSKSFEDKFGVLLEINSNRDHLSDIQIISSRAVGLTSNNELVEWKYDQRNSDNKTKSDYTFLLRKPVYQLYTVKFKKILLNRNVSLGLDTNGQIWSWGTHQDGLLGLGYNVKSIENPSCLENVKNIVTLAMSDNHAVALNSLGEAYSWGSGKYGELGLRNTIFSPVPTKLENRRNYSKVFCSELLTCLIDTEGKFSYFGVIIKIFKGSNSSITLKRLLNDELTSDPNLMFQERIVLELEKENFLHVSIGNGFIGLLSSTGLVYSIDYSDNITLLYSKYFVYSLCVNSNQLYGLCRDNVTTRFPTKKRFTAYVTPSNVNHYYMTIWTSSFTDKDIYSDSWSSALYKISDEVENVESLSLIESRNKNIVLVFQSVQKLFTSQSPTARMFRFNPNASKNNRYADNEIKLLPMDGVGNLNNTYHDIQSDSQGNYLSRRINFLIFEESYDDSFNVKYKRTKNFHSAMMSNMTSVPRRKTCSEVATKAIKVDLEKILHNFQNKTEIVPNDLVIDYDIENIKNKINNSKDQQGLNEIKKQSAGTNLTNPNIIQNFEINPQVRKLNNTIDRFAGKYGLNNTENFSIREEKDCEEDLFSPDSLVQFYAESNGFEKILKNVENVDECIEVEPPRDVLIEKNQNKFPQSNFKPVDGTKFKKMSVIIPTGKDNLFTNVNSPILGKTTGSPHNQEFYARIENNMNRTSMNNTSPNITIKDNINTLLFDTSGSHIHKVKERNSTKDIVYIGSPKMGFKRKKNSDPFNFHFLNIPEVDEDVFNSAQKKQIKDQSHNNEDKLRSLKRNQNFILGPTGVNERTTHVNAQNNLENISTMKNRANYTNPQININSSLLDPDFDKEGASFYSVAGSTPIQKYFNDKNKDDFILRYTFNEEQVGKARQEYYENNKPSINISCSSKDDINSINISSIPNNQSNINFFSDNRLTSSVKCDERDNAGIPISSGNYFVLATKRNLKLISLFGIIKKSYQQQVLHILKDNEHKQSSLRLSNDVQVNSQMIFFSKILFKVITVFYKDNRALFYSEVFNRVIYTGKVRKFFNVLCSLTNKKETGNLRESIDKLLSMKNFKTFIEDLRKVLLLHIGKAFASFKHNCKIFNIQRKYLREFFNKLENITLKFLLRKYFYRLSLANFILRNEIPIICNFSKVEDILQSELKRISFRNIKAFVLRRKILLNNLSYLHKILLKIQEPFKAEFISCLQLSAHIKSILLKFFYKKHRTNTFHLNKYFKSLQSITLDKDQFVFANLKIKKVLKIFLYKTKMNLLKYFYKWNTNATKNSKPKLIRAEEYYKIRDFKKRLKFLKFSHEDIQKFYLCLKIFGIKLFIKQLKANCSIYSSQEITDGPRLDENTRRENQEEIFSSLEHRSKTNSGQRNKIFCNGIKNFQHLNTNNSKGTSILTPKFNCKNEDLTNTAIKGEKLHDGQNVYTVGNQSNQRNSDWDNSFELKQNNSPLKIRTPVKRIGSHRYIQKANSQSKSNSENVLNNLLKQFVIDNKRKRRLDDDMKKNTKTKSKHNKSSSELISDKFVSPLTNGISVKKLIKSKRRSNSACSLDEDDNIDGVSTASFVSTRGAKSKSNSKLRASIRKDRNCSNLDLIRTNLCSNTNCASNIEVIAKMKTNSFFLVSFLDEFFTKQDLEKSFKKLKEMSCVKIRRYKAYSSKIIFTILRKRLIFYKLKFIHRSKLVD